MHNKLSLDELKEKWDKYRLIATILGVAFTISALFIAFDKITGYIAGDSSEIIQRYFEQSDDANVQKFRKDQPELYNLNTPFLTNAIATFPDGTPLSKAMQNSIASGIFDLGKIGIESNIPDEIGTPKSVAESAISFFKPTLHIKCDALTFGRIKLKVGQKTSLSGIFDKKDISEKAFICCSYDPEVVKLLGNRTFVALEEGESQIGVLYYDGENTYSDIIDVVVKNKWKY